MRAAENWKDYELIDTSCGERLERWGTVTLIRPDPQIIWETEKTRSPVEKCRRPVCALPLRGRPLGDEPPGARKLGHPVRETHVPLKNHGL